MLARTAMIVASPGHALAQEAASVLAVPLVEVSLRCVPVRAVSRERASRGPVLVTVCQLHADGVNQLASPSVHGCQQHASAAWTVRTPCPVFSDAWGVSVVTPGPSSAASALCSVSTGAVSHP